MASNPHDKHHQHDKDKHHKHDQPHHSQHPQAEEQASAKASDMLNNQTDTTSQENLSEKPAAAPRVAKSVTITDVELEQLKKDLAEYKDKYLRSLAESENARKRLQKEKQEMIQYALQNVIVDFLHPIDHMENALKFTQQMSEDVKHWGIGFQMILSQFKDVLSANNVTPYLSEGKPFDPHRHEAVETVATSDFPPGTVVEESLKGYTMGDKIIRPARVKVTKAPEAAASNNAEKK